MFCHRGAALLATLGIVTVWSVRPDAQSHRVSLGGAVIVSVQTEREGEPGTFSLPPHGTATGVNIFGGVDVTTRIGIDGEVSIASAIRNTQPWSHPSLRGTTTTEHRDTIVSGLVRIHATRIVDLLAGGGIVVARTTATEVSESFYAPTGWTSSARTERVPGSTRLALTAGADFPLSVGSHVTILPTLRYHFLSRPDTSPSTDISRLDRPVAAPSSVVWRLGAGIRVGF